jgi:hypothetical protein
MKTINGSILVSSLLLLVGCNKREADYTKDTSPICRVHDSQMLKTNVPITYGLIRLNDWGKAVALASSNSFPNAEVEVLAGCIIDSGSPTQAVIYVCPECRSARQKWESDHPPPN